MTCGILSLSINATVLSTGHRGKRRETYPDLKNNRFTLSPWVLDRLADEIRTDSCSVSRREMSGDVLTSETGFAYAGGPNEDEFNSVGR